MKNKKILIIAVSLLVIILAVGFGFAFSDVFQNKTEEKSITVAIKHADGSLKQIPITTSETFLADVLLEEKLIKESEYENQHYTTLGGYFADYDLDAAWWCLNIDGEITDKHPKEIKIKDLKTYTFEYTIG